MIWNKRNAKSIVVLHEYMHKDVYDIQQFSVIDDADEVLWRYGTMPSIFAATFLIKYCSFLGSDLNC